MEQQINNESQEVPVLVSRSEFPQSLRSLRNSGDPAKEELFVNAVATFVNGNMDYRSVGAKRAQLERMESDSEIIGNTCDLPLDERINLFGGYLVKIRDNYNY